MFNRHYRNELAFLYAAGKEYAQENPQTAGLLGVRSGDPDVERLLEGFAFLAARIRDRLDAAGPEIVHDMAELLLPHFLRPLPAASIVEMEVPLSGALRARQRVPAGTELGAVPVDGTSCRFTTAADLDLLPARVQEVQLDRAVGSSPVLRVQVQVGQQGAATVFHPDGLRLFVHGEIPLASTLVLWFARHLRRVEVRASPGGESVPLPAACVGLPGLGPELRLLPWPDLAPPGYRLLQEYFTLPQKLMFVDVRGLDRAERARGERFEIAFHFERPPELPSQLTRDALRTNCVPVVNLFRTPADPVSLVAFGEEHLVRAAELPPRHMAVFEIRAVTALGDGQNARVPCQPFFGFRHAAQVAGAIYYRLRRTLSPIDEELDTWISVARPMDADHAAVPQALSLDVTATNRLLPARLKLGEINQPTTTSPTQARFRNIVAVSRPVRPPLGVDLHWRLIAHLASGRIPLDGAEALRSLLSLYNFWAAADQQAGRANALHVEAVREVRAGLSRRLVRGAPVRGTRFEVDLDEGGFAGSGDAFLFGCALDDLLAGQAGLGTFSELAVHLQPTQREYAWKPRNGWRSLS